MAKQITDPEDWREREVAADDDLQPEEKELCLNFPNHLNHGFLYSDIPVFIQWAQSMPPVECEWIRVNASNQIIAISAKVPKGAVKLQKKARQSNNHSQMVSYGELRG